MRAVFAGTCQAKEMRRNAGKIRPPPADPSKAVCTGALPKHARRVDFLEAWGSRRPTGDLPGESSRQGQVPRPTENDPGAWNLPGALADPRIGPEGPWRARSE